MPKDFYRLAPIEFDYALEDWQTEDRNKWERMRLSIFHLLNISGKVLRSPYRRVWDLMSFAWDERPEDIVFSQEYVDRIRARDKKVFAILKKLNNGKDTKGVNNKT